MREQGVHCAATRRQHRGVTRKGENFVLYSMRKRGYAGNVHKEQAKALIEAIKTGNRPAYIFLKEAVATRSEIVSEYAKIARELYKSGHKTKARLLTKFATDVTKAGFTTQAQERYDKTVSNLNYTPFKDIKHDDIQR